MTVFPHDAVRKLLKDAADQALPDYVKQFWDIQVEGYSICAEESTTTTTSQVITLSISPGRVYLSPKAGAPC
jgi:hypothetical protein